MVTNCAMFTNKPSSELSKCLLTCECLMMGVSTLLQEGLVCKAWCQ